MRFNKFILVLLLFCVFRPALAQQRPLSPYDEQLYQLARKDLKIFAQQVAKDATSELGRAQAIVRWLARNFEWKATDYQRRAVPEIIERRGGNCNELAMVALAAMNEVGIRLRRVHEINIHINTPARGVRARELVKEKGNSYSVFGRRHNDHIWLELYDSAANDWFPADPSSGLIGTEEWLKGRVWFGKRVTLNPITNDMIVPFAVFAADEKGKFTINRTQHYLVDEFDKLYNGKLHIDPAWKHWNATLDLLDDKVAAAFAGDINLHEYETQVDSLADIYEQLRAKFSNSAANRIFVFHTDEFWLNLHHFLYVLGRAANKTSDASRDAVRNAPVNQEQGLAKLTPAESSLWREAVSFYAKDLSRKDAVFDEPLPTITKELALAGAAPNLSGSKIDATLAVALERAAPIYRKAWWPKHQNANRAWQAAMQQLVRENGAAILSFITNVYKIEWVPTGYDVHISGYVNWAGAYSTVGDLLVLSSLADDIRGIYGLETIFHEGMHQWDSQVFEALREQARKQNKLVPRGLSHTQSSFSPPARQCVEYFLITFPMPKNSVSGKEELLPSKHPWKKFGNRTSMAAAREMKPLPNSSV